jgi:hypothetical protein
MSVIYFPLDDKHKTFEVGKRVVAVAGEDAAKLLLCGIAFGSQSNVFSRNWSGAEPLSSLSIHCTLCQHVSQPIQNKLLVTRKWK